MNVLSVFGITAAALCVGLVVPRAFAADTPSALQAQAKVSEAAARATALAGVPGGIVQSAELEHEGGNLVWSFDIRTPATRNVTEIQVDAKSGRIVSKKTETPAQQAAETAADRAPKR